MSEDCESCVTGLRLKLYYLERKENRDAKLRFKQYRKRMGRFCFMCIHNDTPKQAMRGIKLTHKAMQMMENTGLPIIDTLAIADSWRTLDLYRECPSGVDEDGDQVWAIPDEDETEGMG